MKCAISIFRMRRQGGKMSNIKIYVSCHKECFVPKHSMIYPIQVGATNAAKRFDNMLHDDEGINISDKNKKYCELTGQYWAWKNDDADYYGFFHYRRYLSFSDKEFKENPFRDAVMNYLTEDVIDKLNLSEKNLQREIPKYDIITTRPVILKELGKNVKSNYNQYVTTPYQYKEDMDLMLDIIKEKYPEYYDTAEFYLKKSKIGYYCNMFIMKKEIFMHYSEWLFTILGEHEKRRDYEDYNVDAYRISGYLGERLFGIYYLYWKNKGVYECRELQRTLFLNTDKIANVKPAFEEKNVGIALAANDYFVPYMATTLYSLLQHISKENNYDILIFTHDISIDNRKIIKNMGINMENVSIRFIDPSYLFEGYNIYLFGHFGSIETYYRMILPELLPDYHKLLYVDSDMIILDDLAKLYNEDVEGYLLAATRDADTSGLYNGFDPKRKEYSDEVLKLKEPHQYFQAGIINFNLDEFRKTFDVEEMLKFASKEKWLLQDQDVLNKLCEGRVKYVDMSWNVLVDYGHFRMNQIIRLAPQWLYFQYMEARKQPKIIHYAGPEKPWNCPEMDFGTEFWEYAKRTPYNETMLFRMALKLQIDGIHGTRKHGIVAGGIQCIKDHGLIYTIKYFPERMKRERR